MNTRHRVALRVRRLREIARIDQRKLAEISGLSKSTIEAIETGRHAANIDSLELVANALGEDIASLFIFQGRTKW